MVGVKMKRTKRNEGDDMTKEPKRRGRPPKVVDANAAPAEEKPKRRGRPPRDLSEKPKRGRKPAAVTESKYHVVRPLGDAQVQVDVVTSAEEALDMLDSFPGSVVIHGGVLMTATTVTTLTPNGAN